MNPYDVLLCDGRVIDPASGLDAICDVAISGGRIAEIAPAIDRTNAVRWIDAAGRLVVPGLIDIHAHVNHRGAHNGLDPDLAGISSGVTTVVDAGSAGYAAYEGFHHHIVRTAATEVLAFVHIARHGLAHVPEATTMDDVDIDATVATVATYPEVVGVKVRACGPAIERHGMEFIGLAIRAARETNVPLMVHIGDANFGRSDSITAELLPALDSGDIVTHVYTGAPGRAIAGSGRVLAELREARERGVWLDAAHGRYNLSFDVARSMMDQGVLPDTISTDITRPGRPGPVGSMTHTMSKFLALGFELTDVIAMSTHRPATVLGRSDLGTLRIGSPADVAVLELVQGARRFVDGQGQTLVGTTTIRPVLTFKGGNPHSPDYGPFPEGWLSAVS
jgi:dihydroorotase